MPSVTLTLLAAALAQAPTACDIIPNAADCAANNCVWCTQQGAMGSCKTGEEARILPPIVWKCAVPPPTAKVAPPPQCKNPTDCDPPSPKEPRGGCCPSYTCVGVPGGQSGACVTKTTLRGTSTTPPAATATA